LRPLTTKASNGNGRGNEQPIASTSKAAPVQPLFTVSSSSDEDEEGEEDEDLEMALALSESRDLKEANDLRRAMELSKRESELAHPAAASSSSKQAPPPLQEDEDDDLYVDDPVEEVPKLKFGHSNLFSTTTTKTVTFRDLRRGPRDDDEEDEEDDDMEEVVLVPVQNISTTNDKGAAAPMNLTDSDEHMEEVTPLVPVSSAASKQASAPIDIRDSESDEMEEITPSISQPKYTSTTTPTGQPAISVDSGDDDMEEVAPPEVSVSFASPPRAPSTTPLPPPNLRRGSSLRALAESVHVEMLGPPEKETDALQPPVASTSTSSGPSPVVEPVSHPIALPRRSISPLPLPPAKKASAVTVEEAEESSEEFATDWSRSPSPTSGAHQKGEEDDSQHIHIDDAQVEAGDFAHFMSRVKGRNLNDVRNEIDEEIRALNKEKKNSLRDSEDITQMMVGQIQVGSLPVLNISGLGLTYPQADAPSFWHSLHHGSDGS
jgi:DNA excision repair protein ERCC-5